MPAHTQLNGVVPVTYVRLLYEYLSTQGVDGAALLGPPPAEQPGLGRFPVTVWQDLLQRAATHLKDPLLGLHLGQAIAPRHFGLLGYILLSCGTLGGAVQRLTHYQRLIYDVNPLQLQQLGGRLILTWGIEMGRPGPLVDETAITALLQFCRNIVVEPGFSPRRVEFVNPAPQKLQPYKEYFGCTPRFGQSKTLVEVDAALLGTPLRAPDAALMAVLEQQTKELFHSLPGNNDLITQVRQIIALHLRNGSATLASTAAALHLSERSLHRRLGGLDHNFRSLLQDTRLQLAKDYLGDKRLQLAEIAQLLGYSEQSAFTRAFHRQAGVSPLRYRQSVAITP